MEMDLSAEDSYARASVGSRSFEDLSMVHSIPTPERRLCWLPCARHAKHSLVSSLGVCLGFWLRSLEFRAAILLRGAQTFWLKRSP